jgi:hypothetical protein
MSIIIDVIFAVIEVDIYPSLHYNEGDDKHSH